MLAQLRAARIAAANQLLVASQSLDTAQANYHTAETAYVNAQLNGNQKMIQDAAIAYLASISALRTAESAYNTAEQALMQAEINLAAFFNQ